MTMPPSPNIPMAGPWVTQSEVDMVTDAMTRGWYDQPYYYVETFQREFAAWHGRKHALMTPNCTTALHLLLTGLGIGEGDEVIVPDCTWIGSTAAISYLRATPVFCDISPDNWCLDPEAVRRAITPRTKAIIAVDLFGNMADWDELTAIAETHKLWLVEDAAESLGSTYRGRRAGSFGVGAVFSFHRTKTLTTGEGGMLLLDDDALYERCAMWRDHGRKPGGQTYFNYEVTYKYMPFNVQAALGLGQFRRIDELVARKRWIFEQYRARLGDIDGLQWNAEPPHVFNSIWTTALVLDPKWGLDKPTLIAELAKLDVPARPFFYPLSSLPAYGSMGERYQSINPVAYDVSNRGVNLSCAMNLSEAQIDHICDGIRRVLAV